MKKPRYTYISIRTFQQPRFFAARFFFLSFERERRMFFAVTISPQYFPLFLEEERGKNTPTAGAAAGWALFG